MLTKEECYGIIVTLAFVAAMVWLVESCGGCG